MHKHKPNTKPKQDRSILKAAKESLRHVLIISVISSLGHMATTSLSTSAGALGMGIYPTIGGLSVLYGS